MEVSVGIIIQDMIIDTLSGRSPLYRLADFFQHQDLALLLGEEVEQTSFNDTTVVRAMDVQGRLFEEIRGGKTFYTLLGVHQHQHRPHRSRCSILFSSFGSG